MKGILGGLLLVLLLLLAGCPQKESSCSSNFECPQGMFCVDGKCSSLNCKGEGKSCKYSQECCGSLECAEGACIRIPELEHTVKVLVGKDGYAKVYGTELSTGPINVDFYPNCEISGASTTAEIAYGSDRSKEELSIGKSITAGRATARMDGVFGNTTHDGACVIASKQAVIKATREILFNGELSPGANTQIPGTDISVKLISLTPLYREGFDWKSYELRSGQAIPGTSIKVFSIQGTISDCDAANKSVSLSYGGKDLVLREGQVSYIDGSAVRIDSLTFFGQNCAPVGVSPIAKLRIASLPCRYPRTALLDITSGFDTARIEVGNENKTSWNGYEIALDQMDGGRTCLGSNPPLSINATQSAEMRVIEGSTSVFKNLIVKLEKLDATSLGAQCLVADATADVSAKFETQGGFSPLRLKLGGTEQFGNVKLALTGVNGEFKPSGELCAIQTPKILLSVNSPDGAGGVFTDRLQEGSVVFIEHETARQETVLAGTCRVQLSNSQGYAFDTVKRELTSANQELKNASVVYGITQTYSGSSQGTVKSLVVGSSLPFDASGITLIRVNKAGDASLSYKDRALVLAVGDTYSFQEDSIEMSTDCSLKVKTIGTIRNQGFTRIGG